MKLNLTDSTVVFDRETILLLLEVEEFKGSWKAYASLAPVRLTELQRIATIESINRGVCNFGSSWVCAG